MEFFCVLAAFFKQLQQHYYARCARRLEFKKENNKYNNHIGIRTVINN